MASEAAVSLGEVAIALNSSPLNWGCFHFRALASGERETADKYSSGPEAGGTGPGTSTQKERTACS